jgi:hypothetical protein
MVPIRVGGCVQLVFSAVWRSLSGQFMVVVGFRELVCCLVGQGLWCCLSLALLYWFLSSFPLINWAISSS